MELVFVKPDIRTRAADGIALGRCIVSGGSGMFHISDILLIIKNPNRIILRESGQIKK